MGIAQLQFSYKNGIKSFIVLTSVTVEGNNNIGEISCGINHFITLNKQGVVHMV